jgi:hypothetical protein
MEQNNSLTSSILLISHNPLLKEISDIQEKIARFKEKVKEFYFLVLLSQYECPKCGQELTMTGQSQCSCSSGHVLDPTLTFQQSSCCSAKLVRKTFHYACSRCHQTVPSRFLFDERLFDKDYFGEMMQESRDRARKKREEVGRLLAGSRSDTLILLEEPNLGTELRPMALEIARKRVALRKKANQKGFFDVCRRETSEKKLAGRGA